MSENKEFKYSGDVSADVAAILAAVENGASIAELANVSKEELENHYALAFNLYNAGNFIDAETVFQALCIYNSLDPRFWMGLAGCRQALKNYQGAIDAYGMAGTMQVFSTPEPFVYAARCFLKRGKKEEAIGSLKGALALVKKGNPEHEAFKKTIDALLELLEPKKA